MEKVLSYLNEVEEKANEIIEHAEAEKLVLHQELDQRIKNLEKSIAEENKKKLEVLQKEINQDLETELNTLRSDSTKQLEELTNYFSTNHDALVNKLFQKIVGA